MSLLLLLRSKGSEERGWTAQRGGRMEGNGFSKIRVRGILVISNKNRDIIVIRNKF